MLGTAEPPHPRREVRWRETLTCIDCGVNTPKKGQAQKRCPECRARERVRYHKEYGARYWDEKARAAGVPRLCKAEPKTPKLGVEFSCAGCGGVAIRWAAASRYCGESCAKDSRRARDREVKKRIRATAAAREKARLRAKVTCSTPEWREWRRAYEVKRRQRDPKFAVNTRMKAMVQRALRERKAGRSWQHLVGYTLDELVTHLERQFLPGMSWQNRSAWQIDHIRPIAQFTFSDAADDGFRECWALTNLRPLWTTDNRAKSDARTFLL